MERAKAERRRFARIHVDLPGRLFVPTENRETRCRIVDLSPGGARVACEISPPLQTPVVLYVDGFGRFEGVVVRSNEGSFGVRFQCSAMKREKIAEQLTIYLNKDLVDDTVVRRHDRAPTEGAARFTRANGEIVNCDVLDLSLGGVSLKTEARPALGEVVLIAQTAGRIVRHHENGVAIEFLVAQPEKAPVEQPANPFTVVR